MKVLSSKFWREVLDPISIIKTTIQTIIGTVLVGSFFMLFTDYVFNPIDLSGRWDMQIKPESALSKKNQCVDIMYSVLLTQKGTEIIGVGEKSRDAKSDSPECKDQDIFERKIGPGKGKKIKVSGYIKNNYIAPDLIDLSYQEGDQRFTMASLNVIEEDEMEGWYKSNISRAVGKIILSRVKE